MFQVKLESKMEAALAAGEDASTAMPEPPRSAEPPPSEASEASEAVDTTFGDIDDDLFGSADDGEASETIEEPVQLEPAARVTPQPEAPAPSVAVVPPVPPNLEPPPLAPVAQSPAPQPIPAQPAQPPQPSYDELREAARKELEVRYSLSKEDADAMISEPETVIPRLMSQMYLDVYDNVLRSMQVFLPQMVQHVNSQDVVQQRDENDFYTAWPKLREHGVAVAQVGRTYRQLNPMATKEQFIQDVGLHASIALKVPVESPLLTAQAAKQAPPATSQNPPYVPPRGAPSIPPAVRQPSKGMFGELAEEWEELEKF
jgi:hypothetical protein